uniref:Uncharacterized protein n=1 Tax=Chrysotila carterae TaxID=13221 RepID=A0A7S4F8T0_CHRCT
MVQAGRLIVRSLHNMLAALKFAMSSLAIFERLLSRRHPQSTAPQALGIRRVRSWLTGACGVRHPRSWLTCCGSGIRREPAASARCGAACCSRASCPASCRAAPRRFRQRGGHPRNLSRALNQALSRAIPRALPPAVFVSLPSSVSFSVPTAASSEAPAAVLTAIPSAHRAAQFAGACIHHSAACLPACARRGRRGAHHPLREARTVRARATVERRVAVRGHSTACGRCLRTLAATPVRQVIHSKLRRAAPLLGTTT